MNRIILCADSTCDLSPELIERYHVHTFPYHVRLGDREYTDNVDITASDIFENYKKTKTLPKTAAINVSEFTAFFEEFVSQGYDVIHVNLSSGISASFQNAETAANQFQNVFVVDSKNLSSASGLLVIEAGKMIEEGLPAVEIYARLQKLTSHAHASFILDTLEYMRAGGRCSSVVALGANLLNLKPCIEVDNLTGKMGVGKKYRGPLSKVLVKYVEDELARYDNIDPEKIFITHSVIAPELVEIVRKKIIETMHFDHIYETDASCTISSHCGPGTLGILFLTK